MKKTPPYKLIDGIRDVLECGAPMTSSVARKVLEVFQQQASNKSANHFKLASREVDIISMLTKGISYKMIADAGGISFHTVNSHLKKKLRKTVRTFCDRSSEESDG